MKKKVGLPNPSEHCRATAVDLALQHGDSEIWFGSVFRKPYEVLFKFTVR